MEPECYMRFQDFAAMYVTSNKVRELDFGGVIHFEFVPTGQTVNQVYYLEVLKMLREKVRWKRLELFPATHGSCIKTMHLPIWHCL